MYLDSSVFVSAHDGQHAGRLAAVGGLLGAIARARGAFQFEAVRDASDVEPAEVMINCVLCIECRKAANSFENLRVGFRRQRKDARRNEHAAACERLP